MDFIGGESGVEEIWDGGAFSCEPSNWPGRSGNSEKEGGGAAEEVVEVELEVLERVGKVAEG